MKISMTGASDDLIEIDGDIREEFYAIDTAEDGGYIAVSDGTLLSVNYDNYGLWRFNVVFNGSATLTKVAGSVREDRNDVVTLDGDAVLWVALVKEATWIKQPASQQPEREDGQS